MAEGVFPTQAQDVPGAVTHAQPDGIPIPKSLQHLRGTHLTLNTLSPVTENGSFECDRIIKAGRVMKRTRKTKSWKPVFIVLRPNLLSMYRDESEAKLRNQVKLSEVTAVARRKDPKRKDRHVFGVFTPSRNFHMEASSEQEAQDWVENIRREARMYEAEEDMMLASPGGARSAYQGFERSLDANIQPSPDDHAGGYSSSDVDALYSGGSFSLPRSREMAHSYTSGRQLSHGDYNGSFSDLSDTAGSAARLSALSLAWTEGRPSTSSALHAQPNSVYGSLSTKTSVGPSNPSQLSTVGPNNDSVPRQPAQVKEDQERIVYHSWVLLLRSKSKVRQWKKIWMVLRPKGLALYKGDDEYRPLLILPFTNIIEAVEIDPVSKNKQHCFQVIGEDKTYRFCALDEESSARWLGALKSLLSKRRAAQKDAPQTTNAS